MGEENKGVEEEIEEIEEIDENSPDSLDFDLDFSGISNDEDEANEGEGGDEGGEGDIDDSNVPEDVKDAEKDKKDSDEDSDPIKEDEHKDGEDSSKDIDFISEIERLNAIINQGSPEEEIDETSDEDAQKDVETGGDEDDFVGELDMDDVSADPKVFSKVLANYGRKIQEETIKSVMATIPKLISNQVQQHLYMTSMRDKFYVDNPDLSHVKNVVASCASEIVKERSDWKMEQIYTEAAIRSRKVLGINAPSKERKIETLSDAAFTSPSGGGTRQKTVKERTFQDELDEL